MSQTGFICQEIKKILVQVRLLLEEIFGIFIIRDEVEVGVCIFTEKRPLMAEQTSAIEFKEVLDLLGLQFLESVDAHSILLDQILKSELRLGER